MRKGALRLRGTQRLLRRPCPHGEDRADDFRFDLPFDLSFGAFGGGSAGRFPFGGSRFVGVPCGSCRSDPQLLRVGDPHGSLPFRGARRHRAACGTVRKRRGGTAGALPHERKRKEKRRRDGAAVRLQRGGRAASRMDFIRRYADDTGNTLSVRLRKRKKEAGRSRENGTVRTLPLFPFFSVLFSLWKKWQGKRLDERRRRCYNRGWNFVKSAQDAAGEFAVCKEGVVGI